MPYIEWTPDLSVGIKSIDDQHIKLMAHMNALYDAIQEGKYGETIATILADLTIATVEHFQYEEMLFEKTKFLGAEEHRREHEILQTHAFNIQKHYQDNPTETMSAEMLKFLRSWLIGHIKGPDKEYTGHFILHGIE